jgi:hypothetical protein
MRLPVNILQRLAAAVALAGMSGCGFGTSAPTSPQAPVSTEQTSSPDGEQCPNNDPGKPGFRDPCPACGRG